jgi:hypothetical protein
LIRGGSRDSANRYDVAVELIKRGYMMPQPQAAGRDGPLSVSGIGSALVPGFRVVKREKTFPLETQRLAMTSARPDGGVIQQSLQMPVAGRLVGIEFFVDTPSTGDYVTARLGDRTLFPRLLVDLAGKTSYSVDLDEEASKGDLLTVGYFSVDTASKTLTWTPNYRQTL